MTKQAGSLFSVDVTGLEAGRGGPAYARICERIRTAIVSGALAPNARLPSSRTLAADFGVARNTVDWALGQLVADGYIVRRRGAGSFVAGQLPKHDMRPLPRQRSFNKILFPALRIAYCIVPEPLVGAFVDAKHVADGHTALLTQGVLAAFILEGHLGSHLRNVRAIYNERRLAFLEEASCLAEFLDFGPARAGLHLTGAFRQGQLRRADDRAVAAACARAGVIVDPLSKYGDADRSGLVFGFAGASRADSRAGLQAVRHAIVSVRR